MSGFKWTAEQIARLREAYEPVRLKGDIRLDALAAELGRHKSNVSRKARELGLTDPARRGVERRKDSPRYATVEERKAAAGLRTREWIAKNGHPRGALGLKHSESTRATISAKSRAAWNDPNSGLNSEEARAIRAQHVRDMQAAGKMNRGGYVRLKGGRRSDLGNAYFRSAWEANYARYLNLLKSQGHIADWQYEPHEFVFERVKRGTTRYKPDFKVLFPDGSHEWHEVKGWMNQRSQTRLNRMARYYPAEKIILIRSEWFRQAQRSGLSATIKGWEP